MTRIPLIAAVSRWWPLAPLAGALVCIWLSGYIIGRNRAPTAEQHVERKTSTTTAASASSTMSLQSTDLSWLTDASTDVWLRPDGSVRRIRARKKQETKKADVAAKGETKAESKHQQKVAEKLIVRVPVMVPAKLPRYSFGVLGGWSYSGTRVYGATAEVRVAGGLWAGVNVTTQAAVMSLRWSW